MPILNKTKCADSFVRVYQSFSVSVATWNKYLGGLPCPLPVCIAVFHFKYSYLYIFCLNFLLLCLVLCQRFALRFCLPIILIIFPAKSVHPYSSESWHFHGQKQWLVSGWIVSQSFMCNVRLYRSNFDNRRAVFAQQMWLWISYNVG